MSLSLIKGRWKWLSMIVWRGKMEVVVEDILKCTFDICTMIFNCSFMFDKP
uniref:Uncharacterized protein n=1 Tax=Solanum lycopersicum TaxID=4081 RepID=K4DGA3_SOLLC